jgi:hypothetical protein
LPYYTGPFLMCFLVVDFLVGFLEGFLVGFFVGFLVGFAASRFGTPPGMRVAQLGSSSPPSITVLMQVFHVPTPVLAPQQPSTASHMPPRFGTARENIKTFPHAATAVRTCAAVAHRHGPGAQSQAVEEGAYAVETISRRGCGAAGGEGL